MRVAVVDTYYPAFVTEHYAARPGLAARPYEEQLRSLMERQFGTSDAYSHELRGLGHEAADFVVNVPELQKAWRREQGARRGWLVDVPGRIGAAARQAFLHGTARAQIAAFDPEVVYVQDLWFFSRAELDALRGQGRLVVSQIASAPPGPEILQGFDLITTSFPHYVERFRALGVDSEYFPIAFDERVLQRAGADAERDVGVGLRRRAEPGSAPGWRGAARAARRAASARGLGLRRRRARAAAARALARRGVGPRHVRACSPARASR